MSEPLRLEDALAGAAERPLADLLSALLRLQHALLGLEASGAAGRVRDAAVNAVVARGRRLEGYCDLGERDAVADFVFVELVPLLDTLAKAGSEARLLLEDPGQRLAALIWTAIYEDIGAVATSRRWFHLEPLLAGATMFDAARHRAIGSVLSPGAAGVVVELHRVGLRDATNGAVTRVAHVVVGRG